MSVSRATLDTDTEVFSTQEPVVQGAIKEGYLVFLSDGAPGIGSVRQVEPDGRPELIVYIENAGDFVVPFSAVDNANRA